MKTGGEMDCKWLPGLVEFNDGNWEKYLAEVYQYFEKDFIKTKPYFRNQMINHRHFPEDENGRHQAFWHLVQEGEVEDDRTPDLRRCERIRWPRPIIEHESESYILVWENQRRGKTNICIFFSVKNYLVVLGKRPGYLLLLSAYPIEYENRKEDLLNEYHAFHNH